MQVSTYWADTARGPALYISLDDRKVAFLEDDLDAGSAGQAAISLWEGIAGGLPRGRIARWHWRRDLGRVRRGIERAITERKAYSTT